MRGVFCDERGTGRTDYPPPPEIYLVGYIYVMEFEGEKIGHPTEI